MDSSEPEIRRDPGSSVDMDSGSWIQQDFASRHLRRFTVSYAAGRGRRFAKDGWPSVRPSLAVTRIYDTTLPSPQHINRPCCSALGVDSLQMSNDTYPALKVCRHRVPARLQPTRCISNSSSNQGAQMCRLQGGVTPWSRFATL